MALFIGRAAQPELTTNPYGFCWVLSTCWSVMRYWNGFLSVSVRPTHPECCSKRSSRSIPRIKSGVRSNRSTCRCHGPRFATFS